MYKCNSQLHGPNT